MKNKILTGTYILQTNRAKFNQNEINPTCQLCYDAEETLEHFLLKCKGLDTVRNSVVKVVKDIQNGISDLLGVYPAASEFSLLQMIVDSNVVLAGCCVDWLQSFFFFLQIHNNKKKYFIYKEKITEWSNKNDWSRLQEPLGDVLLAD